MRPRRAMVHGAAGRRRILVHLMHVPPGVGPPVGPCDGRLAGAPAVRHGGGTMGVCVRVRRTLRGGSLAAAAAGRRLELVHAGAGASEVADGGVKRAGRVRGRRRRRIVAARMHICIRIHSVAKTSMTCETKSRRRGAPSSPRPRHGGAHPANGACIRKKGNSNLGHPGATAAAAPWGTHAQRQLPPTRKTHQPTNIWSGNLQEEITACGGAS